MKKIIYKLSLAVLALFASCDSDFEEINTNPNDPFEVPSELLLSGVIRSGASNVYQSSFNSGEGGSCWVQHLGKTIYNTNELYIPRQTSIDNAWFFLYSDVIKDADVMRNLAIEEGNSNIQGVALVLMAQAYHVLTDTYGDVPFTEALKGDEGLTTPIYDDSETVIYPGILSMLDEAMVLLNGQGDIDSSQDLIYGGDYILWRKYAASLKFKVLMRASSGGYDAASQLQSLVNSGYLFSSNDDEAKLTFLSAVPNTNPWYEALVDGGRTAEWSLGEQLVNYMLSTDDPRLPVYAQEVGGDGSGNGYVGKPAGISLIGSSIYGDPANISLIGSLYLEAEQPYHYMSYAHLALLMAEAAEKGYISGDAETYFNEGIAASVESNGTVGMPSISYLGGTAGLDQIYEQIWVATFLQGFEPWAEWRRTGVPALPLAIDAVEDRIPTRYTYPAPQQSYNNINYTSAVQKLGGEDNLTTPLWWQKN